MATSGRLSAVVAIITTVVAAREKGRPPAATTDVSPAVYWASSPTLANQTLLLAGAGMRDAAVRLCRDESCTVPATNHPPGSWNVTTWDHSLQLLLPGDCGPPCFVEIKPSPATSTGTATAAATMLQVNRPDVWWTLSAAPATSAGAWPLPPPRAAVADALSNIPLRVTVQQGGGLRAFGRSLAWSADVTLCLSASVPPGPVPSTRLLLGPGLPEITAVSANCYEATFDLGDNVAAQHYPEAVIRTHWGDSDTIDLTVGQGPSATTPLQVDVLGQFGGNLSAAIRYAAG